MREELEHLRVVREPERPLVCFLGGAKVSDKLAVLEALAPHTDVLAVGGAMAYTFLLAQGLPAGASRVEPDRVPDARRVLAAARSAVLSELSFDARRLGQPVHLSDLFRVLQENEGVVFVDINALMFKRPSDITNAAFQAYLVSRGVALLPGGAPRPVQGHLRIFPARPNPASLGKVLPAELAFIESPDEDVIVNATGGLES